MVTHSKGSCVGKPCTGEKVSLPQEGQKAELQGEMLIGSDATCIVPHTQPHQRLSRTLQ